MNDLVSLLPIIGIFLIFWLLVIRPASRRQKQLREVQAALQVGDEVITSSGFFGVIDSFEDDGDKVRLRIAPDVVISITRTAIVGKPVSHQAAGHGSDIPQEEN